MITTCHLQWGAVDAEIKVPAVEKQELTDIHPLNPRAGWNIATHASPSDT